VAFIEECYRQAGLEPPAIDVADAAKNRLMAAGKALPPPAKAREQLQITRPVAMTLGERFYDHIKRVLDRGGLFLRSAPDGRLILTAPNAEHPVLFKAVHAPRGVNDRGSVVDYAFTNSTVDRVRTYVVYSRGGGGGGHTPHTKLFGGVEDIEMKGYGYNRVRSYRDWHVKTNDEAELMARRRMAEARRRSWNLTLTVSGHRTRLYGTEELGVWRPDCMVRFESDQLDMRDTFYIETVRFSRGPNGTFTHLRLLRRQDLIFGLEDF
jgi:prophage tail gpP-like protein